MNPGIITEIVSSFAGFLGSLGVIAGTFYKWAWKPYVKRKEEREIELNNRMREIASGKLNPVTAQLEKIIEEIRRHEEVDEKLKHIAEQNVEIISKMKDDFKEHEHQSNQRDMLIRQNAEIIKRHEEVLDYHPDRILVLETVTGLKRGEIEGLKRGEKERK